MSPEQALIQYAERFAEVKALQAQITAHIGCEKVGSYEEISFGGDCIDQLFSAPKGPDGEFPRFSEFYDPMCQRCKDRLKTLNERKDARARLGSAKRTLLCVGKRLLRSSNVYQVVSGQKTPLDALGGSLGGQEATGIF